MKKNQLLIYVFFFTIVLGNAFFIFYDLRSKETSFFFDLIYAQQKTEFPPHAQFFTLLTFRVKEAIKTIGFLLRPGFAATDATINATIKISICGNNLKEDDEQCDTTDLNGITCQNLGYTGGQLNCRADCTFDTSRCTAGGGGGGGGGGGYISPPSETKVTFSGRAYPKSAVTLLKDAQIVATTIAGSDANFQISLSGLSAGNYLFSVYSEDKNGNRSNLLTFPVSVTLGAVTNVSGIFIAPTIDVDKNEVKQGENIAIFGQSVPQADITIQVSSEEDFFVKTTADANGIYLYNFGTENLDYGTHLTKSKAAFNGIISSFSKAVSFTVGVKTVLKEKSKVYKGDFNNDNRINLVDFSIAAYWYKRPNPPKTVDLNNDGKVDLVDFSIIAYYWTG